MGLKLRRGHHRRPRRPARRRRPALRRLHPRDPRAQPDDQDRDPDARFPRQGPHGARAGDPARPIRRTCSTTTSRPCRDLYRNVRPGADYQWSLTLLQKFKAQHPDVPTKSGIMLGLGETHGAGAGDAARPARARRRHGHHRPVPAADARTTTRCCATGRRTSSRRWRPTAWRWASRHVASGPLVRSSYHADRQAIEAGVAASA